jgi:hypothetical protein
MAFNVSNPRRQTLPLSRKETHAFHQGCNITDGVAGASSSFDGFFLRSPIGAAQRNHQAREPVSEKLAAAAKASARPAAMPQPAKYHKDCMLNVGCLGAGVQKRALAAMMGVPAESVPSGYYQSRRANSAIGKHVSSQLAFSSNAQSDMGGSGDEE